MNLTLMEPAATAPGPRRAHRHALACEWPGERWRWRICWRWSAWPLPCAAGNWKTFPVSMATKPGWGCRRHIWPPASRSSGGHRRAIRSNVFLLLPVAALHLVFAPSVWVLRAMALASGVAALAANFWLCRRVFDRRAALVSTAVLAVLPIAIAYSRFAWDSSQTILATVLVLYYSLSTVGRDRGTGGGSRRRVESVARQPGPSGLVAGAGGLRRGNLDSSDQCVCVVAVDRAGGLPLRGDCRAAIRAAWQRCGAGDDGSSASGPAAWLLCGVAVAILAVTASAGAWFCPGLLATAGWRLVDLEQAGLFVQRLVQLFSGGTIFEFIPGAARTSTALGAADVAFVSLAGGGGARGYCNDCAGPTRCASAAWPGAWC